MVVTFRPGARNEDDDDMPDETDVSGVRMTLDEFRVAVRSDLVEKFGDRLGKTTIMTDTLHVRPRWVLFAWIDGRAPTMSFPFASGSGADEEGQFRDYMRRVILTLSRKLSD
jgi:hypothetical protein